jgi:O-antigen/teichoic acid export membrane protein
MTAFDRRTIYKSALFAVAMQWAVRAIGLVSVVVLARLLSPADFGVMAVALSAAAFVELFGWIGLRQALLRVKAPERSHYDTAWTVQLCLFTLLALLLGAIAPLAADFYDQPVLTPMLWVISTRYVCMGLNNIGIVDFEREMDFGRDMRMRLSVRVLALIASLVAAVVLQNYWALVIGLVCQSIFFTAASYIAHPFRPRFDLSRRSEILGVSLWMFIASACEVVQQQVERLVLGRFVSVSVVGLFSVSKDLASIFTQEIATALNRVTFVTVARQDGPIGSHPEGIARLVGAYAVIVAPLAGGLVATASDSIAVLLGPQWAFAAPFLQIIAVYAGFQALYQMSESILQAAGFVKQAALLAVAGALGTVAAVVAAAMLYQSALAVAWAAFAANGLMLLAIGGVLAGYAKTPPVALAMNLVRPAAAAVVMTLILWGPAAIETGSALLDLAIEIAVGAASYAAALLLLWAACGRPEGAESELVRLLARVRRRSSPV